MLKQVSERPSFLRPDDTPLCGGPRVVCPSSIGGHSDSTLPRFIYSECGVQTSLRDAASTSFGSVPGSGVAGSRDKAILNFWRNRLAIPPQRPRPGPQHTASSSPHPP